MSFALDVEGVAECCTQRTNEQAEFVEPLRSATFAIQLEALRTRLAAAPELARRTDAEWFLDNYYLIAETAQTLRTDVPRRFYRELPVVVVPASSGVQYSRVPRVFLIANELASQLPGPPDRATLEGVLRELQTLIPLRLGELWALPAMIRASCLERILVELERVCISVEAEASAPDETASVVPLAVKTLIALKALSWRDVFEEISLVHRALTRDPSATYGEMDFASCDRYRRVVERLARASDRTELAVAERTVAIAAAAENDEAPRRHVGYYLIDAGRKELESDLGIRPSFLIRLGRFTRYHASPFYLLMVAIAIAATLAPVALYLTKQGADPWLVALGVLIALLPASAFAIVWVQWLITHLVTPHRLPRLNFKKGIPPNYQTLVVIPTLLGSLDEVHRLVGRLELHYLANPDPNLNFVLLADYTDSSTKTTDADNSVLLRASEGIDLLNQRYRANGPTDSAVMPFHLLVRERRYNTAEGVWMGWERKRGKLEELNRLLAGDSDTGYTVHVGASDGLVGIRFVITLDSDTELPREAARTLVSILAHPLNRARFEGNRVVSGYTVLQPRLDISPEAANRSRFSRIFASDTGLDIYSRAVSNVYQDFFGSGVYVGKGIYDVDAFRRSLEGQVPENSILSHDLFEGIYGRAGLVSDVVLYEDYPPNYVAFARRLHRWIRGDWQLLPWLRLRVPTASGERVLNPFSHIDRWKMLDNLRRSVVPLGLFALLVSGWTWLPPNPFVWTSVALLLSAGHVLTELFSRAPGMANAKRWLISLAFLPHEALIVLDAVARTLVRLFTRRRLLEWTTASHQEKRSALLNQRKLTWGEMVAGPIATIIVVTVVAFTQPTALLIALPFATLWLLSPEIALFLAAAPRVERQELSAGEHDQLRLLARRTWLFFETFVRPDDSWLPPDNVQHQPALRVAHRTSPTNIGLYLASCASAYDLGYIGLEDFCSRARNTLKSVGQLERHRDQLLNWYDTQSLEPLVPKYVSTVDNGNFAASLIALRGACTNFATAPIFRDELWLGLADVAKLLGASVSEMPAGAGKDPEIEQELDEIDALISSAIGAPEAWLDLLVRLSVAVANLSNALQSAVRRGSDSGYAINYEVLDWLELLERQVGVMRTTIEPTAAWFYTMRTPPAALSGDAEFMDNKLRLEKLAASTTLDEVGSVCDSVNALIESLEHHEDLGVRKWLERLHRDVYLGGLEADARLREVLDVARACDAELDKVDFTFLYDEDAHLMSIGYDVSAARPDSHHYDLLASEARLASLVAIALGQVPKQHWIHLGRPVVRVEGAPTLLSWSGTMFEYLMPELFTRSFGRTLLGSSSHAAVARQIRFAREHRIPWGISESGFATTDSRGDYQYRAFGVSGLGLKRGLGEDLVVAPYASMLAIDDHRRDVLSNLRALEKVGALSEYGLCEAIDYRSDINGNQHGRERRGTSSGVIVNAHMAHHQGMILLALGNVLNKESMVARFHLDPRIQTVAHLLHERIVKPSTSVEYSPPNHVVAKPRVATYPPQSWQPPTDLAELVLNPAHHVLSNGSLSLACDALGHTRLWRGDIELRPRELNADPYRAGSFCLFVDIDRGGAQPITGSLVPSEVTFWPHSVETVSRLGELTVHQELFVASDEDLEVRRVEVVNDGLEAVELRITGCAEVSIQRPAEHHRHPAFSRLFLETSSLFGGQTLICRRRPRGPDDHFPVLAQSLVCEGPNRLSWETSREAFVGRGREFDKPRALDTPTALGRHEGTVLDSCLAQQVVINLGPGERKSFAWFTAVASDEGRAVAMLEEHGQLPAISVTLERSANALNQRLAAFGIRPDEMATIQRLGSQLLARPRSADVNIKGSIRRRLWGSGISGDRPVILFHRRSEEPRVLEILLRAHELFRTQGLRCDLVIVVHDVSGYVDEARERIRAVVRKVGIREEMTDLEVIAAASLGREDRAALESAAAFVSDSEAHDLESELARQLHRPRWTPRFAPMQEVRDSGDVALPRPTELLFDNGIGGFRAADSEYVIFLDSNVESTPAPWCNVLSNPDFGCLVSERGLGSTWAVNAGENRLTPWSNDPLTDRPSEAVYLRDEETALTWTPTPAPKPAEGEHEISHGFGTTTYRHRSHHLEQRLQVTVHPSEPVKVIELELQNLAESERRLTATYFADWVLGARWAENVSFVTSSFEPDQRALFVRNRWSVEHPDQVAFLASSQPVHGFTCDRAEFFGTGGPSAPSALECWGLSNCEVGASSCAALQVHIDLPAGGKTRIHFALGWGASTDAARALATRAIESDFSDRTAAATKLRWSELLGAVRVRTPEPATDLMLNRWALYQTISSRLFARTGFYQSSGAYGFRDQLQDVMALSWPAPKLAREHLLRAARHQFDSGDVLHWWHPPHGQGVRTRCSDDLLWLPFVVAHYVESTGDLTVLHESTPFLTGPELARDERERYGAFQRSATSAPLLEHCMRALDRAYALGPRGLPRMGGGDWNDGMNLVGSGGSGESVWLGWFLYATLRRFAAVLGRLENTKSEVVELEARAQALLLPLESSWDGQWYWRATFDDGTPLGTASANEARIDSIAQSWAVISGGARRDRAARAVKSAVAELVDGEVGLIRLLTPPFHLKARRAEIEPGYIAGYPPGVRENGAQYTHAATWLVWAVAGLGDSREAGRLYRMLNPILSSETRRDAQRYRVEPYVLAADVYDLDGHRGQGGWTWYTGSSAWFWRLGVEQLLGLRCSWPHLEIRPRIPPLWPGFQVTLTQPDWSLDIEVANPHRRYDAVVSTTLDDKPTDGPRVDLRQLEGHHELAITLGPVETERLRLVR